MRLPVGTRITLGEDELIGLVGSEILAVEIHGAPIDKDRAYILRYIESNAAPVTQAHSSSGYELQCMTIVDGEWTFDVTKEPDTPVKEVA